MLQPLEVTCSRVALLKESSSGSIRSAEPVRTSQSVPTQGPIPSAHSLVQTSKRSCQDLYVLFMWLFLVQCRILQQVTMGHTAGEEKKGPKPVLSAQNSVLSFYFFSQILKAYFFCY